MLNIYIKKKKKVEKQNVPFLSIVTLQRTHVEGFLPHAVAQHKAVKGLCGAGSGHHYNAEE